MDPKAQFVVDDSKPNLLNVNIDTARAQSQEISVAIKALEAEQESFSLAFQQYQKIKGELYLLVSPIVHVPTGK